MDIFHYRPFNGKGIRSYCSIEVFKSNNKAVIICTELPKNSGMSVTNAVEHLIERVAEYYELDLTNLIWIEHYSNWKTTNGDPYDREEESWSLVEFNLNDQGKPININWLYQNKAFVDRAIAGLTKVTCPTRHQQLIAGEQIALSECCRCEPYIMPIYCSKDVWTIIINSSEYKNDWQIQVDKIIQASLPSCKNEKFSVDLKGQNYQFLLKEEAVDIDNPDRCLTLILAEK